MVRALIRFEFEEAFSITDSDFGILRIQLIGLSKIVSAQASATCLDTGLGDIVIGQPQIVFDGMMTRFKHTCI